jgi:hypothetical protein
LGLFWNLIQQSQISEQYHKSSTLEQRVSVLEQELHQTRQLLHSTLRILEEYTNRDIDGDGRIG